MRRLLLLILLQWLSRVGLTADLPVHKYVPLGTALFQLKASGKISYPEHQQDLRGVAETLAKDLSSRASGWRAVAEASRGAGTAEIQFLNLGETPEIPFSKTDGRFREAFKLEIGKRVRIFAGGKAGARYAVQQLKKLLNNRHHHEIPSAVIVDYPDFRWRGAVIKLGHTSCGEITNLPDDRENVWKKCMNGEFDKLASMRLNLLGLISPVFHRLNETDMARLRWLFAAARDRNLEPMPIIDSKLWGIPASVIKVDAIEGVRHDRVRFQVRDGRLIAQTAGENIIPNGDFADRGDLYWNTGTFPGAPDWHVAPEANGAQNRNKYLTIQLPKNQDPQKVVAIPEYRKGAKVIAVEAAQYYELGVILRSSLPHGGNLRIGLDQYDENKRKIPGVNLYPVRLRATTEWQRRWIPVFTSRKCKYLAIRFVPINSSSQSIRLSIDNIALYPMRGELVNVLINEETAPEVVSLNGTTRYEEGIDYEVRHAPIREWSDTPFQDLARTTLRVLPHSRLSSGDGISVSFDSLLLEYQRVPRSKYSAASKYTYGEYRRIFSRLKELNPVFVHVAMDEHQGGLNRDSRSLKLNMSNRQLFAKYLNSLGSILRDNGVVVLPNGDKMAGVGAGHAHLVVWDDMLNPWHNGGLPLYQVPSGGEAGVTQLCKADPAGCVLERTILLASWWYSEEDKKGIVRNTPDYYRKTGYQYFATTWYQKEGIANWFDAIDPELAEGVIATTWNNLMNGLAVVGCAGWNRNLLSRCLEL